MKTIIISFVILLCGVAGFCYYQNNHKVPINIVQEERPELSEIVKKSGLPLRSQAAMIQQQKADAIIAQMMKICNFAQIFGNERDDLIIAGDNLPKVKRLLLSMAKRRRAFMEEKSQEAGITAEEVEQYNRGVIMANEVIKNLNAFSVE